jgi:hypothetical protein
VPENREVTLTVHGLDEYNQAVDGEVFARKFAAFMRGLGKSDFAANGSRKHKFMIAELRKSSATAVIRERIAKIGPAPLSGAAFFVESINDVYADTQRARAIPRAIVQDIASLSRGAGKSFSFAEVKASESTVIRIDEFLEMRARRVLNDVARQVASLAGTFEGAVFCSFEGVLKAVDLRGDMKKAVLLLSAGDRQIECVVNALKVTRLGEALDKRVTASGTAYYERNSGLPVRLDVRDLTITPPGSGLTRWRGAFDIPTEDRDRDGWDRS